MPIVYPSTREGGRAGESTGRTVEEWSAGEACRKVAKLALRRQRVRVHTGRASMAPRHGKREKGSRTAPSVERWWLCALRNAVLC